MILAVFKKFPAFAPALEWDDRAPFRDLAALGSLLFSVTLVAYVAYAAIINWAGAPPRDGTTLAAGLDLRTYGRAAVTADPGRFYDLAAPRPALA